MNHTPNIFVDQSIKEAEDYEIPKRFHEYKHQDFKKRRIPFWNPLLSTFYGRNGSVWMIILLTYFILYVVTILIFVLMLGSFVLLLSSDKPTYSIMQPGLTFAPICKHMNNFQRIKYNEKYQADVNCLVDNIKKFVSKYGHLKDFGDCTLKNDYGYVNRTPCVFLKLNRSIGFRLNPIENSRDLPSSAPDELRSHIDNLPEINRRNKVWLSCQTNDDHKTKYFPYHGIPAKVLEFDKAYTNSIDDHQRIIAVQFDRIPVNKNVKIECHAWAKNIERVDKDPDNLGRGYLKLFIHIKTL